MDDGGWGRMGSEKLYVLHIPKGSVSLVLIIFIQHAFEFRCASVSIYFFLDCLSGMKKITSEFILWLRK